MVNSGVHHLPLPCGAAGAPCEAGPTGQRRTALYPREFGESVSTRVQWGFSGKAPTTTARASPSDSADLQLSKSCTTWVRHPTLVRWSPIRRHELDPRRRKSSIYPASVETVVFSAAWWLSTAPAGKPELRPQRCSTACSTSATSSTSEATATARVATPNSPK